MVAYYTIFGRQVGSHYLSMGVLATLFSGGYFAFRGGSKKAGQTPPINASSPDEADFIQYAAPNIPQRTGANYRRNFLKQADEEEKKTKH
ncbi:hypothetical protein AAE478_000506 [Parahypoxylon ruwenzoriense]